MDRNNRLALGGMYLFLAAFAITAFALMTASSLKDVAYAIGYGLGVFVLILIVTGVITCSILLLRRLSGRRRSNAPSRHSSKSTSRNGSLVMWLSMPSRWSGAVTIWVLHLVLSSFRLLLLCCLRPLGLLAQALQTNNSPWNRDRETPTETTPRSNDDEYLYEYRH